MTRTSASFTPGPASCYNNPHAARENAGRSPREAGRRAGEMLTTLKLTVVRDSTLIGMEVERGVGRGGGLGVGGGLLPTGFLD